MKKILSALLLLFAMLLSACGGIKYEFKEGILYADGKEASGTFEFKLNGYKTRAKIYKMVWLMDYLKNIILMEVF